MWKGSRHYIAKLFEPNCGPNRNLMDKNGAHLRVLYRQAKQDIDTKQAAVWALLDAPATFDLQQHAKRQREEALDLARATRNANSGKKMRALTLAPKNSDA